MLIYIAIYLILMILCLADKSSNKKLKFLSLSISFSILLTIVGTRDETGTDWLPYWTHYNTSWSNEFHYFQFEIGYQALVDVANAVGLSYLQFLFLFTFTYLIIFYRSFWYFKYPNTIAFLFYSTYIVGLMGTSRQMLALAICSLAITKILEKNNFLFIILVIIASFFHKSSFIFILAVLIVPIADKFRKESKYFIIVPVVFAVIFFIDLDFIFSAVSPFAFVTDKLQNYLITDTQSAIYLVDEPWVVALLYIKRASFAAFFLIESRKSQYTKHYQAIAALYALGFAMFCALYPTLPAVAVRLSIYFSFFDIIFLSYFAWNSQWKNWAIVGVLLLSMQGMRSSLSYDSDLIVPYKGVFFNSNMYRQLR
jgi:hypothetical protein